MVFLALPGSSREYFSHVNTLALHLLLSSPFRAITVFTSIHPLPDSSHPQSSYRANTPGILICFQSCPQSPHLSQTIQGRVSSSKRGSAPRGCCWLSDKDNATPGEMTLSWPWCCWHAGVGVIYLNWAFGSHQMCKSVGFFLQAGMQHVHVARTCSAHPSCSVFIPPLTGVRCSCRCWVA